MKILDRVRHSARVKHFSLATERVYVYWAERYIRFHNINTRTRWASPRSTPSSPTSPFSQVAAAAAPRDCSALRG